MTGEIDRAIDSLRVKEGDPITRKLWNGLLDLVALVARSFAGLQSGTAVRLQRYPGGVNVVADVSPGTFTGRFTVRLSGKEATIGAGEIDGITPRINGVKIDGYDDSGKAVAQPRLKISGAPNSELRSWICAVVAVDPETKLPVKDDPSAVTIAHLNSRTASPDLQVSAGAEIGICPLALLIWSDTKTISRFRQIKYFDQHVKYTPATDATLSRIEFEAAS